MFKKTYRILLIIIFFRFMSKEISEIINLIKLKKLIEAEKKCSILIKKIKENFEILNIYAIILFKLEKYDQAIEQWQKVTELNPKYFYGFNNLGNVFLVKKDFEKALKNYNKAIDLSPNYYEAIYNKGNVYLKLKDFSKALENYDQVISIKNDYAPAHQGRAIIFKKLSKFDEAIKAWQKVSEIRPGDTHALVQRGDLLFDSNRLDEALKAYNNARAIDEEKPFLLGSLVHTKTKMCDWNKIEHEKSNLKNNILENKRVSSPYVTLTVFDDPKIHLKAASIWSNEHYQNKNQKNNKNFEISNNFKKIKIGYYSADFRTHAMGHLLVRMFELHDKEKFEIYGFYFGPKIKEEDELSKRIINSFDKFINITDKNDDEVVEISRSLGINIAVDLMCYTGNFNRFGIFTKRCAPIQVNFLGYPGTSGSDFIDYIFVDKEIVSNENKNFFSEKLIFLPDVYQPNEEDKKISDKQFSREELNLPNSKFIFACFNTHQKITSDIFSLWMKILKKKNDSILWLLQDNIFSEKNLKMEAEKNEIDPKRLIFAENLPLDEHLSRIKHIDLFLDTSPYNAHTTCSDALRQCVPVVTMKGKSFASRVAASLLSAMDLNELIITNLNDYEKLAIKISSSTQYLNELKEKIRKKRFTTNIFKTNIFTKNMEKGYSKIFQNYVEGNATKNFEL